MKKSTKTIYCCYAISIASFLLSMLHLKLVGGGALILPLLAIGFSFVLSPVIFYCHGKNFNPNWMLGPVILFVYAFWVLAPALNSVHHTPKVIRCASHLKQIGLAMKQYAMDNKDWFPNKDGAAGLEQLRSNGYLTDYKVYVCPSTTDEPGSGDQALTEENISYVYRGGLKESGEDSQKPLVWDKPTNHKKFGNILYVDGHVSGITASNWFEKGSEINTEEIKN